MSLQSAVSLVCPSRLWLMLLPGHALRIADTLSLSLPPNSGPHLLAHLHTCPYTLTLLLGAQIVSMWGLGGAVGVLGTGVLGQALYNWRKGAMPFFAGLCIMTATIPILWLINGPVHNVPVAGFFVALVGGALSAPPGPCARCEESKG